MTISMTNVEQAMLGNEQIQEISLSKIHHDRETQIRVKMCEETVQRYFDVMEDGATLAKFPPILLYRDQDGKLWLADGHHRVEAAKRRGFTTIHAKIIDGTKSDAIWAAAKANGKNGLQLGRADIRRAVEMVCAACPDRSNVIIAETLGCDEKTVRKYRPEKSGSDKSEPEKRLGKDGKSYSVKRQKSKTGDEPKNERQAPPPAEERQFEEDRPPLPQPVPEEDAQFVQTVKLQNIPLNDPERLIACLFDLFSVEYREKLVHDLMEKVQTDDGEAATRRIMKKLNKTFPPTKSMKAVTFPLKNKPKVNEKYCCDVKFEPDPDDDYFDWLTDEEREELRELQKNNPNRLVPQIRNLTIQNIPEHKPDQLIACLFSRFKVRYREKLLYGLFREMFKTDGKELVTTILTTLLNEFENQSKN